MFHGLPHCADEAPDGVALRHDALVVGRVAMTGNVAVLGIGDVHHHVDGSCPVPEVGRRVGLWWPGGLDEITHEGDVVLRNPNGEITVGVCRPRVQDLGGDTSQIQVRHQRDGMVDGGGGAVLDSGAVHPGLHGDPRLLRAPGHAAQATDVVVVVMGDDQSVHRPAQGHGCREGQVVPLLGCRPGVDHEQVFRSHDQADGHRLGVDPRRPHMGAHSTPLDVRCHGVDCLMPIWPGRSR